jgi:hypothetical protein
LTEHKQLPQAGGAPVSPGFMTCEKGIAKNPLGFSVWTTAYGRGVMLNVAASQQLFLLLPPLRGLLKATR